MNYRIAAIHDSKPETETSPGMHVPDWAVGTLAMIAKDYGDSSLPKLVWRMSRKRHYNGVRGVYRSMGNSITITLPQDLIDRPVLSSYIKEVRITFLHECAHWLRRALDDIVTQRMNGRKRRVDIHGLQFYNLLYLLAEKYGPALGITPLMVVRSEAHYRKASIEAYVIRYILQGSVNE